MEFHFGCHCSHEVPFLQDLIDQVCGWVDAFFRRSPHLDERAYPSAPADPPRFAAHDVPVLLPPPR